MKIEYQQIIEKNEKLLMESEIIELEMWRMNGEKPERNTVLCEKEVTLLFRRIINV